MGCCKFTAEDHAAAEPQAPVGEAPVEVVVPVPVEDDEAEVVDVEVGAVVEEPVLSPRSKQCSTMFNQRERI